MRKPAHTAIDDAESGVQSGFTIPFGSITQIVLSFGGQALNVDARDHLFSLAADNPIAQRNLVSQNITTDEYEWDHSRTDWRRDGMVS